MSNKLRTRSVIFAAVVAAWSVSGAAFAVDEVEPNNLIGTAQPLVIGSDGTATVNGVMGAVSGAPTRDIDFYSFEGKAGDVVTVDIDGGMLTRSTGLDSILAIFGANGGIPLRQMDNASPADAGSVSALDARIDNFVLPETGKYFIGVSSFPGMFVNATTLSSGELRANSSGAYTLIISGVTPSELPALQINILIKPDTTAVARLNPKSKGSIPVALLSSADFDAMDVDPATLTFGADGTEQSFERCNDRGRDYNGDGLLDRVCHFDTQLAGFEVGDTEGVIHGVTNDGKKFEGSGWLKVLVLPDDHRRYDRDHDHGHHHGRGHDHDHGDHDRGHDDDHGPGKH
jgi:hypothetical protein